MPVPLAPYPTPPAPYAPPPANGILLSLCLIELFSMASHYFMVVEWLDLRDLNSYSNFITWEKSNVQF